MGRGHKNCKSCGFETGPRTKICPKCGTPFQFKGDTTHIEEVVVEQPAVVVQPQDESETHTQFSNYIRECKDEREALMRSKYCSKDSKTWESHDGKFRIRYSKEIWGVPIGDGKHFVLTVKNGATWDLANPHRFSKLRNAVKTMVHLMRK